MHRPLTFAYRNVVFGRDLHDAWGLYRVQLEPYAGLSTQRKLEVLGRFAAFAAAARADFQLLRVSRTWSVEDYVDAALGPSPTLELLRLLDRHRLALDGSTIARPELFLAVRLGRAREAVRDRVLAALGLRDAAGIGGRALDDVLGAEEACFGRVADYLDVDRASTLELQWLLRRTGCRAGGAPWLDRFWEPQAVVLDADDEHGGRRFVPLEADVLRPLPTPIRVERDHVELGGELQTTLVLGALPETTTFPGRTAELLFAPLEAVDFPVDACLAARWVSNDAALSLVRRRIVDADHAFTEESHGDHGPTSRAAARPSLARELEDELSASDRPPLLRAQVSYVVAARDLPELDARVSRLRRELSPIALHRPKDLQLQLWLSHLPAQLPPVRRFDDLLLPEQAGAMVPTATHAVGARTGLLLGRTLSGSRQPVLFDVREGSRTSRAPAILCSGTLGSGKTMTAQLLALHAHAGGSRVIDLDPKGDHRLTGVVGAAEVEDVELSASDRGMLDPLRIAPEDLRVELAHSFLTELLPSPVPAAWQTEIRAAVADVAARGGRSSAAVVEHLGAGGEEARAAARAIEVHAGSGLLQLGFADDSTAAPEDTPRSLTSLRIANLVLPAPGTPRDDLTQEERTGRALLRLLAVRALHLASSDPAVHKLLIVEELSQLISDAVGLGLVQRMVRLCRSQNATPVLVTQVVEDVGPVADLVGCFFAFGVETDREAERVLRLFGLHAADEELRRALRGFRRGRCLMRDYDGRTAPVQIELFDDELLRTLDTTPGAHASVASA